MNNDLVEIVCILDRSGSMTTVLDDSIGGFNTFLKEQQQLPGRANMTLVLFDHEYKEVVSSEPVGNVAPLTRETYVPRGQTALYDAIGRTLANLTEKLAKTPEAERPAKVLVAILTDGHENASREFRTKSHVFDIVSKKREEDKWEFVYLGANQDAMKEGVALGLSHLNSFNYASTGSGTVGAYRAVSNMAKSLRSSPGPQLSQEALDQTRRELDEQS